MKKSEIKVGETYVGKNGRKRRVVSEGGTVYAHQADRDTVNYIEVRDSGFDREKNMTRASFASWAVARSEGPRDSRERLDQ